MDLQTVNEESLDSQSVSNFVSKHEMVVKTPPRNGENLECFSYMHNTPTLLAQRKSLQYNLSVELPSELKHSNKMMRTVSDKHAQLSDGRLIDS